jgi:hypothetical protein
MPSPLIASKLIRLIAEFLWTRSSRADRAACAVALYRNCASNAVRYAAGAAAAAARPSGVATAAAAAGDAAAVSIASSALAAACCAYDHTSSVAPKHHTQLVFRKRCPPPGDRSLQENFAPCPSIRAPVRTKKFEIIDALIQY